MTESVMLEKAKDLAIDVVELCKEIKGSHRESVLTNQLLRSGTSSGAQPLGSAPQLNSPYGELN